VNGQGFTSQESVGLYLDTPYSYPFTVLTADANGNISGKVKLPTGGIVQGLHLLSLTLYILGEEVGREAS
jgi:hypothetical protein